MNQVEILMSQMGHKVKVRVVATLTWWGVQCMGPQLSIYRAPWWAYSQLLEPGARIDP